MSTPGGARLAQLRKAQGITQTALARRAGISMSLLSKIEVGDRTLTAAIATALARALRISLDTLYGKDEIAEDQSALLEDLRTAVRRYDIPDQTAVPDPTQLRAELDRAHTLRDRADLAGLLRMVPGLLTRATTYAHASASRQGWALLTEVYSAVMYLAVRNRWMDLVELVSTRQVWAAEQLPQPLLSAAASGRRALAFFHCGDFEGGLSVVDRAIVSAETALTGVERAFATGDLHMRGMNLTGRLGDRDEAQWHIHAAQTAAEAFPADLRIHGQDFGPARTALNVLWTHGDLGQPREAIRLADELTNQDTGLPPNAIVDAHLTTARAHLDLGDRDNARTSLVQAWHLAPQKVKVHPEGREVLRVLISLHRRTNPQLVALAKQAGLST